MNAADFADWWDKQRDLSRGELDAFIEQNPNLFGIAVAGATNTAMDMAASTVDSLRFGSGMAEGTPGGFGKDALRLIGLLGPVGKVGQAAKAFEDARLAKATVDPGHGICGWVSSTQALAHVGFKPGTGKIFVAVEDLVSRLGKVVATPTFEERISILKNIGADIGPVKKVSSFDEVTKMAPKDGSVVVFSVAGERGGQTIGHALYAFRDWTGRVRIMDRGGDTGLTGEIFDSLAQVAEKYRFTKCDPIGAAVLQNISGKILDKATGVLAMAATISLGLNAKGVDTVAEAFETFKKAARGETTSGGKETSHTVTAGDSLPTIATKYYGDESKWPLIYEANREPSENFQTR
jgi:LysM repeat protein